MGEVSHNSNHVVNEGSVDELGNDGFSHQRDDVTSLGVMPLPFSQLLTSKCQNVVDDSGEDSHGKGKEITQNDL